MPFHGIFWTISEKNVLLFNETIIQYMKKRHIFIMETENYYLTLH